MIKNYLEGKAADASDVVGIYPLLPDDTCRFLVSITMRKIQIRKTIKIRPWDYPILQMADTFILDRTKTVISGFPGDCGKSWLKNVRRQKSFEKRRMKGYMETRLRWNLTAS